MQTEIEKPENDLLREWLNYRLGSPGRSDGSEIFWDDAKQAIVIVTDGEIQTFYPPDRGVDFWWDQCNA